MKHRCRQCPGNGSYREGRGVVDDMLFSSHPETPDRGAGSAVGPDPLRRSNSSAISRSCNAAEGPAPTQSSDVRGSGMGTV